VGRFIGKDVVAFFGIFFAAGGLALLMIGMFWPLGWRGTFDVCSKTLCGHVVSGNGNGRLRIPCFHLHGGTVFGLGEADDGGNNVNDADDAAAGEDARGSGATKLAKRAARRSLTLCGEVVSGNGCSCLRIPCFHLHGGTGFGADDGGNHGDAADDAAAGEDARDSGATTLAKRAPRRSLSNDGSVAGGGSAERSGAIPGPTHVEAPGQGSGGPALALVLRVVPLSPPVNVKEKRTVSSCHFRHLLAKSAALALAAATSPGGVMGAGTVLGDESLVLWCSPSAIALAPEQKLAPLRH
jgi:hypothetical protein